MDVDAFRARFGSQPTYVLGLSSMEDRQVSLFWLTATLIVISHLCSLVYMRRAFWHLGRAILPVIP